MLYVVFLIVACCLLFVNCLVWCLLFVDDGCLLLVVDVCVGVLCVVRCLLFVVCCAVGVACLALMSVGCPVLLFSCCVLC